MEYDLFGHGLGKSWSPQPGIGPGRPKWSRECKSRMSSISITGGLVNARCGGGKPSRSAAPTLFRPSSSAQIPSSFGRASFTLRTIANRPTASPKDDSGSAAAAQPASPFANASLNPSRAGSVLRGVSRSRLNPDGHDFVLTFEPFQRVVNYRTRIGIFTEVKLGFNQLCLHLGGGQSNPRFSENLANRGADPNVSDSCRVFNLWRFFEKARKGRDGCLS